MSRKLARALARATLVVGLPTLLTGCAGLWPFGGDDRAQNAGGYTGGQCLATLGYSEAGFSPIEDFSNGQGCGITNGVALRHASIPLDTTAQVTCPLALTLGTFERTVVQPAAERHFGQSVVELDVMAHYACRERSTDRSRLSEHAFGRAIDIGGFRLANGRWVRVTGWRAGGREQAFLREVARGACRHFTVVLTPNTDADHHNHFHLDLSDWPVCDA